MKNCLAVFLSLAYVSSSFQLDARNVRGFALRSSLPRMIRSATDSTSPNRVRRKRKDASAPSQDTTSNNEKLELDAVEIADTFSDPGKAVLLRPEMEVGLRENDDLLADISEFRRTRDTSNDTEKNAKLKQAIGVLGTVLSYNFVIIIGFFLWFVTGCVVKFGFESDVVIDGFTGLWEWLVLPLLSTHMALTFLSAGIEKFAGLGEP
mmetsp:Transcript_14682/g.24896  ORF Transcript_14682/g.24896 Transcript_14682/m.24896 type:complete len:207 (-) Transcript_14682:280-900(-)